MRSSSSSRFERGRPSRGACAHRLGVLLLAAATRGVPAAPTLAVEPELLDFGRVRADDTSLVRRIKIANRGNEPLQIFGIESGCGCAVAQVEHEIIPVGAATELEVRLNLRGRRGQYRRDVLLRTNDPQRPNLPIPVIADIISPWELTPSGVAFGDLAPDRSATQSLRLVFHPPTGRVESVAAADSWLQASAHAETTGVWRVEVAAVPPYPSTGWLVGRVVLATDRAEIGQLQIGCTAVIREPLMLLPAELRLTPAGPDTHFMLISGSGAAGVEIERITLDGRSVKWTARRLSDGALQVRLSALPTTPEWDGREITIHLTPAGAGPLRLPVRVVYDR